MSQVISVQTMPIVPYRKLVAAFLPLAGAAVLCYVLGAVVMFFQLPTSDFLGKALIGVTSWREQRAPPPLNQSPAPTMAKEIDLPGETFDGLTLYAHSPNGQESATQAFLINMQREVVHRWAIPFSRAFPNQSHLRNRQPDSLVCFFDCRLFPNGDLLAIFHGRSVPAGCGLARLDKDSNVVWTYAGCVHHDVDVADDGTIYALQEELVSDLPKGFETISNSRLADYVVVLSPDGKPIREPISILAAFQNSPFAAFLAALETPEVELVRPTGSTAPHVDYDLLRSDPLHPNCVRVLSRELASKFPNFKAGHLLISVRNLSIVAMLDPAAGNIVWATRGPWYAQHDSHFLDDGNILMFDNLGSPQGSRVLEYNPETGSVPWSYSGEGGRRFFSSERGMSQRLPNGNTLILSSEVGELIEVTQGKKVVWTCALGGYVTTARRYSADELPFLQAAQPRRERDHQADRGN